MNGYGEKIKLYRKLRSLSQDELGYKLGVTKSYISKLENEKTPLSLETLGKIAEILSVDPKQLINNKIQEPSEELKEAGAEWIILGKKMEEQGITPKQIEQWAKIVKAYEKD
ncbi:MULTISPECIES: helix-turn-helix domain-containing protein [unclassified Peribacillus]|uniref:helix-turn-helix domain-containing protein n=1 Tax=unclassified Peribacillus TaxID=2675266 RepID=UPI00366C8101